MDNMLKLVQHGVKQRWYQVELKTRYNVSQLETDCVMSGCCPVNTECWWIEVNPNSNNVTPYVCLICLTQKHTYDNDISGRRLSSRASSVFSDTFKEEFRVWYIHIKEAFLLHYHWACSSVTLYATVCSWDE